MPIAAEVEITARFQPKASSSGIINTPGAPRTPAEISRQTKMTPATMKAYFCPKGRWRMRPPGCKAAWLAVEPVYRPRQRFAHVIAFPRQCAELSLQILSVLRNAGAPVGEAGEGVAQPLEFGVLVTEHALIVQGKNR